MDEIVGRSGLSRLGFSRRAVEAGAEAEESPQAAAAEAVIIAASIADSMRLVILFTSLIIRFYVHYYIISDAGFQYPHDNKKRDISAAAKRSPDG